MPGGATDTPDVGAPTTPTTPTTDTDTDTEQTSSDIDVGAISEALNNKMDRDGMNAGNPACVIIETYHDENGNWYRVYSDGWCEQGGKTNQGSDKVTVTLLKQFANTDYNIITTLIGSNGAYLAKADATVSNITTTNFLIDFKTTTPDGIGSMIGYFWRACGYVS